MNFYLRVGRLLFGLLFFRLSSLLTFLHSCGIRIIQLYLSLFSFADFTLHKSSVCIYDTIFHYFRSVFLMQKCDKILTLSVYNCVFTLDSPGIMRLTQGVRDR